QANFRGGETVQIQPYLFFDGRCDEAIEFYGKAIGAEVKMLMRHKDSPEPHQPGAIAPGAENKVMHAQVRIGESMVSMSDGRAEGKPNFQGFSLSLTAASVDEVDRLFAALLAGGKEKVPLTKTFFSPRFGMLTDRFGVGWIIYVLP